MILSDKVLRVLILGGTTEARRMAAQLAENTTLDLTLSLAGRTREPVAQPVPTRVGGFGGAAGLAAYLSKNRIDLLVDATHPYAAQISMNAVQAAALANVPLLRLERDAWRAVDGDIWHSAATIVQARDLLGDKPRRAFLALGRQELLPFEAAPQHAYVVRSVDPVEPPLDLPRIDYITARGPFNEEDELALLQTHRVDVIVCKNSGGAASYGKIAAARHLRLPVIMVARPLPALQGKTTRVRTVTDAVAHVHQCVSDFRKRGV
ncbi:cobalt-precorrin-6A reductase [Limoniibacter endophyticus]|uniref:Cobalt-precorrin-6A/precorrin-6x reductase n=1 Tax=Limoniibacter endophyticus TaxID=1565040 RepID=A0A8J3GHD9_9HYPH|nr:cobalt-precorrin-6A reductase [Limoniibacter endophyticus]GHC78460.1 cobalt-precorrin-6A/precorrin-6x reductase [Limoniibacter endophyticus]